MWKMVTMVMRKAKNGILPEKTVGATDLKFGINIQLHSESNKGWVPFGHTSSFSCVKLKYQNGLSAKSHKPELDNEPIFIWNQYNLGMFLSTCILPHSFLCLCQAPKNPQNGTSAILTLRAIKRTSE